MSVKTFTSILIAACVNTLFAEELPLGNVTDLAASGRRILGGEVADPSDFRFLVRLQKGNTICSGNIVANQWILTAAICTFQFECPAIEIFPATWEPYNTPTIHGVLCFTPEEYPRLRFAYEISLIKTREDLLEGEGLSIIPLPQPGTIFAPDTSCVIAGWGEADDGTPSGGLLKADVRIQAYERCNDIFKQNDPKCVTDPTCPVPDIPKRVLCTVGSPRNFPGICYGDSGGPLLVNDVLAGVAIATVVREGKCLPGSSSIYTNVADYLPWIYSFIDPEKDTSSFPINEETSSVIV